MAEYQSIFTGQEVDNAIEKLRNWIAADAQNVDSITVSGNTYAVLWKIAPTNSNHVYGIGLHNTTGKVVQVESTNGVCSIKELDAMSTDTQNTTGSSPSTSKIYLVGAGSQSQVGEGVPTYSNENVYEQNGNLYATYSGSQTNGTQVATQGWVLDKGYTTNVGNITKITMNGNNKGTSGNVNLGDVVTGGTTKYAHPSFTGTSNLVTNGSTATTPVASESHTHGITLSSNSATSTGAIKYLESVSDATGTTKYAGATFSGTSATSGDPSDTITVASDSHTHGITVNLKSATSAAGLSSATSAANLPYLEDITITSKKMTASFTGTSKKSDNTNETKVTPASSSHTHTATSAGTVTLTASTVSTDGPKYIEEVVYTAPTVTPVTVATGGHIHGFTPSGSVSLGSNSTASDGVKYLEAHTAASLGTASTGTVTLTQGSGKLEAYDAATSGTKKVSNGTRIPVITTITSGGATGTGAGTAAPNEHTHNVTVSGTTGNDSGDGVSVATAAHTHGVTLTANTATADGRIQYLQSITTGSGSLTSNDTADGGIVYLSSFTPASLGTASTSSAAPGGHKHTITMSGSTGNNSGTKVDAVTAINAGSGSLTTNSTADGGIYYLNSHTPASLTAQSTASVGISGGSGSLNAYENSTTTTVKINGNTNRIPFLTSFSAGTTPPSGATPNQTSTNTGNDSGNGTSVASTAHRHSYTTYSLSGSNASGTTKYAKFSAGTTPPKSASFSGTAATITPTLTGTTTFVTGYSNFSGGSLTGTKTFLTSISGGSGSLESYDAATGGTKKVADGTRIGYVAAQGTFSAGTTPPDTATPGYTATNTENNSGSAVAAYTSIKTAGSISATRSTSGTAGTTGYRRILTLSHSDPAFNTTNAAPNAHKHSYSKTTSVTLSGGTAPSLGAATIYYLAHGHTAASAGNSGTVGFTAASLGTADTGTVGISGASYTPAGSVTLTAGTAPSMNWNTGTNTDTPYIATMTNGNLSLSGSSSYTGAPYKGSSDEAAATTVASHTHTHTYDKTTSVSLTAGTAPSATTYYLLHGHTAASLTGTTTFVTDRGTFTADSASGAYLHHSHTGASVKSTSPAAPHTHTHPYGTLAAEASANNGTNFNAVTGYGSFSGGSATSAYLHHTHTAPTTTTRYLSATTSATSGTTTAAAHTHTHSYGSTTALTTTKNSGSGVSTISGVSYTAPTPTTYYLEHGHTVPSLGGTTTFVTGYPNFSGGNADTKYFHPTFTGSAGAVGSTTSTADVVGSLSGGGLTTKTVRYMAAAFTGDSVTSGGPSTTVDAAPANHTHNVSATGNITLSDTAASGGVDFVSSITKASRYIATAPSLQSPSDTTTVASSGHTHNTTATGTVSLSLADSTATGKIGVITAVNTGTGSAKYLTASVGTPSATTNVAANGHTHTYTPAGSVSLGLSTTVESDDTLITGLNKD